MAAKNRRRVDRSEQLGRTASRLRALGVAVARLIGALAVTSVVVTGAVALYGWFTTSETFAVNRIEVHHAQLSTRDALVARTGITPGVNIFSLDLSAAARAVEQDPWVTRATVTRELPDVIHVVVEERQPVALVALESLYAVDASGVLFKRVRPGDALDLPIVTGLSREAFVGDRRQDPQLRTALLVVERWAASSTAKRTELAEVHVGEEGGRTAFVIWAGEPAIELRLGAVEAGDAETIDQAFVRLERVWDEIERRGVRAAMIDLGNRQRTDWVPVRLQ